jgi:hypothetical protein
LEQSSSLRVHGFFWMHVDDEVAMVPCQPALQVQAVTSALPARLLLLEGHPWHVLLKVWATPVLHMFTPHGVQAADEAKAVL